MPAMSVQYIGARESVHNAVYNVTSVQNLPLKAKFSDAHGIRGNIVHAEDVSVGSSGIINSAAHDAAFQLYAVFTCCILLSILMNSLLFVIPPLHGLSITIYCDSSTCCSYQSPILPGLFFTALGSSGLVLNNLVHFRVLLTTHVLCTIDLKRDMTSLPSFLVPSRWMCVN
ncbi:hypothetical protein MRX96_046892 [Rhipicephalus microplus]